MHLGLLFTGLLGDFMPLLAKKFKQHSFVFLDDFLEVFSGVQVWGLGWP